MEVFQSLGVFYCFLFDNMNEFSYTNSGDKIMANAKKNIELVCDKRLKVISEMTNIFKVLSDQTRLELLFVLEHKSLCVGEFVEILGFEQSLVSHQLKVLRDSNLVSTTRKGNKIYYTLADEHITNLLDVAREHASEKV